MNRNKFRISAKNQRQNRTNDKKQMGRIMRIRNGKVTCPGSLKTQKESAISGNSKRASDSTSDCSTPSKKSKSEIPIVDFSVYNLSIDDDVDDDKLQQISKELRTAFTTVGFVYLKNSGVNQEEVEQIMEISKEFFLLPEEKKSRFKRGTYDVNVNHGWVSLEMESLNPRRPGDLKEAFNVTSIKEDIDWPSEDVEKFREMQVEFFLRCKELALRVLRTMALSLGLQSDVFLAAHRHIGTDKNDTTLRNLYYPPIQAEKVKKGQVRCGEHADYGSITLVFQSHEKGLQVQNKEGEFISAPPIPGTVLINIADLMQRWTSDEFTSATHRVLLPPAGDQSVRQSMAFFVQPDNDAIITCVDGSNKYPPVNSMDYLMSRFKDTYGSK